MRYIIGMIMVIFLSGCNFFQKEDVNIKGSDGNDLQGSGSINSIDSTGTGTTGTGASAEEILRQDLGDSVEEITNSFYSQNTENQEVVNGWLSDSSNQRTTHVGDVIEFLNYCEKLITKKTSTDIKKVMEQEDFEDYKVLSSMQYFEDRTLNSSSVYEYFQENPQDIIKYQAAFEVSLVYEYLDAKIGKDSFDRGVKNIPDKGIYHYLFIDYIDDYELSGNGCKDLVVKYGDDS